MHMSEPQLMLFPCLLLIQVLMLTQSLMFKAWSKMSCTLSSKMSLTWDSSWWWVCSACCQSRCVCWWWGLLLVTSGIVSHDVMADLASMDEKHKQWSNQWCDLMYYYYYYIMFCFLLLDRCPQDVHQVVNYVGVIDCHWCRESSWRSCQASLYSLLDYCHLSLWCQISVGDWCLYDVEADCASLILSFMPRWSIRRWRGISCWCRGTFMPRWSIRRWRGILMLDVQLDVQLFEQCWCCSQDCLNLDADVTVRCWSRQSKIQEVKDLG